MQYTRTMMLPYKKLIVWQKSFTLTLSIYKITSTFPETEKFGLQSQIRRAAVSIPSNIAEGSKRGTAKDFASFLRIALGSGAELETQLLLVRELGYISQSDYSQTDKELTEVLKILTVLIKKMV